MAGLGDSPVIAEGCGCGNPRNSPWSWTRSRNQRPGTAGLAVGAGNSRAWPWGPA